MHYVMFLFSLLVLLSYSETNATMDDIVFGLWSGSQVIGERVSALARTWLQLIPHVHIYTDTVSEDVLADIVQQNTHINMTFHFIHAPSHVLKGSIRENFWNLVQDRHIATIIDLYEQEPNRRWYFFGDDDTYIYPDFLMEFLSDKDPSVPGIYGQQFAPFSNVKKLYKPESNESRKPTFAQGGAGFIVSQALMKNISHYLPKCRHMYITLDAPSDMRLSLCIYRYSGGADVYLESGSYMNGNIPTLTKPKGKIPRASFHHIVPPMTDELWHAQISVWKLQNSTERYVDWSLLTLSEFDVEIGEENRFMHMMWGYRIWNDITDLKKEKKRHKEVDLFLRIGDYITAKGSPRPVFAKDDYMKLNPVMYVQRFERGIVMHYICDENVPEKELVFDSFLLGEDYGTAFRVKCPKPRQWMIENQNGSPLRIVVGEENDL